MSFNLEAQKLEADALIRLYELDASNLGASVLRFHSHPSFYDTDGQLKGDLIWQGQVYKQQALETDGLERRTDGKASTPTLRIQNVYEGRVGGISALCIAFDDFAGAKLTVTTTFAQFLDADNFAAGNPKARNEYKQQIWYFEQKTGENVEAVSFELSNPIDFGDRRIPSRDISSTCTWANRGQYRGETCGYTGAARYTVDGQPTTDPLLDQCGGKLSDCKLRFGDNAELPFGGFPAAGLI